MRLSLLIALVFCGLNTYAQTYTVSGYVRDCYTGKALPSAICKDSVADINIKANEYGFFSFKTESKTIELKTICWGYNSITKRINLSADTIINIEISPDIKDLSEKNIDNKWDERHINSPIFVPKGEWMVGGSISYQTNELDNFSFIIIENWNTSSYNFKVTPYFLYTFKDNTGVGAKFSYKRSYNKISSLNIKLDDELSFSIGDYESINQMFYSTGFIRNYLAIGNNKRFGLYVDSELSYGFGQNKIISGKDESLKGTYETINEIHIGVIPGLTAFINGYAALEVAVDVLGINYKKIDQEFNRVDKGSLSTSGANFKINLFSIRFGISIYI